MNRKRAKPAAQSASKNRLRLVVPHNRWSEPIAEGVRTGCRSLPRPVEIQVRDPVDGFGKVVSRVAKTRPVTSDGGAETAADRESSRPASLSAGVPPRVCKGWLRPAGISPRRGVQTQRLA